jgi:biotin transport system substrate-specific component
MSLCSWIAIPFPVSFTLQTFAVLLISACFPVGISVSAMLAYLFLGLIGAPIFSGFGAGPAVLFGISGGFLLSFPLYALIISLTSVGSRPFSVRFFASSAIATLLSYACGCIWYMFVFTRGTPADIVSAIALCVLPFIIPDVLKICLCALVIKKLDPFLKRLPHKDRRIS